MNALRPKKVTIGTRRTCISEYQYLLRSKETPKELLQLDYTGILSPPKIISETVPDHTWVGVRLRPDFKRPQQKQMQLKCGEQASKVT